MALRGPLPRDRGETIRKLSPYDVFPPSQRRFRRDRKGSQVSYGSVGVMENRRNRVRGQPTPREEERECVRIWKEVLSLLLSFSSVGDIMHSKGVTGGGEHLNDEINCSPLSDSLGIYLFWAYLPQDSKHLFFGSTCRHCHIYLSWFHKLSICGSMQMGLFNFVTFNDDFSLFSSTVTQSAPFLCNGRRPLLPQQS